MITLAQNFRGTLNNFELKDFILFKTGLEHKKTQIFSRNDIDKDTEDFNLFINQLEYNFHNWSRFFATEAGITNFLIKNGMFLILFILLIVIFIFKVKNNIKLLLHIYIYLLLF